MAILPRYGPPDGDVDVRAYGAIATQAFAGDRATFEGWLRGFGADIRVLRKPGIVGGLVFYRMGQHFGGRSVPMWGIAGVAIKPEERGKGHGRELMQAVLRENFESGAPISTLYPAAPALYRALGWEFAGSRLIYVCRAADLPNAMSALEVRPAAEADEPQIARLYATHAASLNGCLDRSEAIWRRVRRVPDETPLYGYLAGDEGYTLYFQKRDASGNVRFDIHVRDLVCRTPAAASALLGHFARHASVAENMYFFGAPNEPLLHAVLRGPYVRVHDRQDWMLRIVRVKEALEARGYPPISAELSLDVRDEALPENAGHWKLALEGGAMRVSKGGTARGTHGALRPSKGNGGPGIDIRGLAALYSGALSPSQLRASGLLIGADKHDATLAAVFAGPAPWMPDYF